MAAQSRHVSPYSADDLACARTVVTHAERLAGLDPVERADVLRLAMNILRKDRAIRCGTAALRLVIAHPTTPGDAA